MAAVFVIAHIAMHMVTGEGLNKPQDRQWSTL